MRTELALKPLQPAVAARASGEGAPARAVLPSILLSQSGAVSLGEGPIDRTLFPADVFPPGSVTALTVTQLAPNGARPARHFAVDAKGRLDPFTRDPSLGTGHPFELSVTTADGARYVAVVDVSPKKVGKSHQGYEPLSNVALQRIDPPAPPKPEHPAEVTVGSLLLSQSGGIALPEGWRGEPLVRDLPPGLAFEKLEVTALDAAHVRPTRTYAIDARGRIDPFGKGGPIGSSHPYRLTLVADDGTRYIADVDISPKKLGRSHRGYEAISNLRLRRSDAPVEARASAPLDDAAKRYVETGGAAQSAPRLARSPAFLYLTER